MSQVTMDFVERISYWYIEENFTYIRVIGCLSLPHILPLYISGRLLWREVDYQRVGTEITLELKRSSKRVCLEFQIYIGIYSRVNFQHAKRKIFILML